MLMALAGQRYLVGSVHLIGAGQSGVPPHASAAVFRHRALRHAVRGMLVPGIALLVRAALG
jgi:hypothetical protein